MKLSINDLLTEAARKGLDDSQICAAAKVNYTTLYRWRKGTTQPRMENFNNLVEAVYIGQ